MKFHAGVTHKFSIFHLEKLFFILQKWIGRLDFILWNLENFSAPSVPHLYHKIKYLTIFIFFELWKEFWTHEFSTFHLQNELISYVSSNEILKISWRLRRRIYSFIWKKSFFIQQNELITKFHLKLHWKFSVVFGAAFM